MIKNTCLLLLLTISFSSCQKILDYYHYHDGNQTPDCNVIRIEDKSNGVLYHRTTITYNDADLPELVYEEYIGAQEFTIFNPYVYDSQNRLIAEGPYSTERPSMRRYVYEGNSKLPVRDTLFSIAHVYVEDFEYDSKGRIIRELRRLVAQPDGGIDEEDEEWRYFYDVHGNRQEHPSNIHYPGVIEYGDKPSLYSLSPSWQIQYRDFSKNSTLTGATFNGKGLPLTIKNEYEGYFQPFHDMAPGAAITYECK
jgi:hypothetical protein